MNINLTIESMGKKFRVAHISKSVADANFYCSSRPYVAVIATDQETGLIFIADRYPIE
jgi:hypothetical protein